MLIAGPFSVQQLLRLSHRRCLSLLVCGRGPSEPVAAKRRNHAR
jgi:hypothetical protein